MDGDSPCEPEWYLSNSGFGFTSLFDRPLRIVSDDLLSIREFDDRQSLMSSYDMSDRAIRISSIEIILHEHDTSSYLEDE